MRPPPRAGQPWATADACRRERATVACTVARSAGARHRSEPGRPAAQPAGGAVAIGRPASQSQGSGGDDERGLYTRSDQSQTACAKAHAFLSRDELDPALGAGLHRPRYRASAASGLLRALNQPKAMPALQQRRRPSRKLARGRDARRRPQLDASGVTASAPLQQRRARRWAWRATCWPSNWSCTAPDRPLGAHRASWVIQDRRRGRGRASGVSELNPCSDVEHRARIAPTP